jgi:hypothetical protein
MGFVWGLQERKDWEERYWQLLNYKQVHGHCRVPRQNPSLGRWVENQRQFYRKGALKRDRIDKLNEIGFIWKAK